MSRVSQKARLSSSITKGSNAIDLGSNSGVDVGRKAQPSVTAGGIGVTQEVANVGGMSVSLGGNVDITPIDFGINYDATQETVSIATGAEIPGGLLGLSGGIEIDLNTGEVIGGSIGGEVGGLGINVSNSRKGGLGIEFTLQIPGTPIELSLGFGFPPTPTPGTPTPTPGTPTPTPGTPTPTPGTPGGDIDFTRPVLPPARPGIRCTVVYFLQSKNTFISSSNSNLNYYFERANSGSYEPNGRTYTFTSRTTERRGNQSPVTTTTTGSGTSFWRSGSTTDYISSAGPSGLSGSEIEVYRMLAGTYYTRTLAYPWGVETYVITYTIVYSDCSVGATPTPTPAPTPTPPIPSSPFPNPPPRKVNMDLCCQESIKLQRLIVRHLGAERTTPTEDLPEGVTAIGSNQDGINQAYPFSVKKQWLNPTAREDEKIKILNDRQLALVLGGMIERLERTLGTAEFYKDPDKKLRQSESNMLSWLTGENKDFRYPDPNDFWANSDDGIINEKTLEVRSIADGIRYQIEAINRLERILPIAELKDSSIPARWIYPNGKGQLRVGNLIHLCEYMIRKSDKDMGYWPQKITIKAANPAIEDDEPITSDIHSVADMLRVMMQQILDVEGDGDMGSNYDLRRTYLDVMAFQLLAKNNKYLQAITEYLSFEMIEEVSKIPIPFDPFAGQDRSVIEKWWQQFGFGSKETLKLPTKNTESEIEKLSEGLLQNSEIEVNTIKFGTLDEKKDPKTLKESLIEILKHSSASAAAVTEVASEGALERIVDAAQLAQKLTSFLMRRDIREGLGIGDLDAWIASAEKGYTDDLATESLRFPESNPAEPYGRPATQNPNIREIDTKEDKAD
jgi:hypothetical protein